MYNSESADYLYHGAPTMAMYTGLVYTAMLIMRMSNLFPHINTGVLEATCKWSVHNFSLWLFVFDRGAVLGPSYHLNVHLLTIYMRTLYKLRIP